jgi:hypothetical protein
VLWAAAGVLHIRQKMASFCLLTDCCGKCGEIYVSAKKMVSSLCLLWEMWGNMYFFVAFFIFFSAPGKFFI